MLHRFVTVVQCDFDANASMHVRVRAWVYVCACAQAWHSHPEFLLILFNANLPKRPHALVENEARRWKRNENTRAEKPL